MSSAPLHPDDMREEDFRPGTRVKVDGVVCELVTGDKVPRAYWDWLNSELDRRNLLGVAMLDGGKWSRYDSMELHCGGNIIGPHHRTHRAGHQETYCALVPISFIPVEENEWGKVMP